MRSKYQNKLKTNTLDKPEELAKLKHKLFDKFSSLGMTDESIEAMSESLYDPYVWNLIYESLTPFHIHELKGILEMKNELIKLSKDTEEEDFVFN